MRYIIFSRVSTAYQTVANQIAECEKYVSDRIAEGDTVLRFEEPETSSRIDMDKRHVLQEMLNTVQRGDTLVIYKLDRLARSGDELVYIYNTKLVKRGVNIISLYEPYITKSQIHIYAYLGENERENVRIRTTTALRRKQQNFEKVGHCWYGYKTDPTKLQPREKVRSSGKPYLLIPDEIEAEAVRLMTEAYKEGKTYQEITDYVNEQGALNRKGKPLQKMTVYRAIQRHKRLQTA